jgi:hypothetical protein
MRLSVATAGTHKIWDARYTCRSWYQYYRLQRRGPFRRLADRNFPCSKQTRYVSLLLATSSPSLRRTRLLWCFNINRRHCQLIIA